MKKTISLVPLILAFATAAVVMPSLAAQDSSAYPNQNQPTAQKSSERWQTIGPLNFENPINNIPIGAGEGH